MSPATRPGWPGSDRVRDRMAELDVDALLLSLGADLPWLTGYEAMPLERLTMLVVPVDAGRHPGRAPPGGAPGGRAPRRLRPAALVRARGPGRHRGPAWSGARPQVAVSDRTWATFVLALQRRLPGSAWRPVVDGDRARCGRSRTPPRSRPWPRPPRPPTGWPSSCSAGQIPLIGRTERSVSLDLGRRLVDEGHQRVNFAIVGSGPNAASPHHDAGSRVIEPGDAVVCDFGGTMNGYCSDITRTVWTGPPSPRGRGPLSPAAAGPGGRRRRRGGGGFLRVGGRHAPGASSPRAATATPSSTAPVTASAWRSTRIPTSSPATPCPLAPGHAFSVEPGIYLSGRYGARIEDIVVATDAGPLSLNQVSHELTVVEA